MNYSRKELIQTEATMNQIRNAIYHLARFMKKNGVTDTIERMRRMGRNIARSYIKYWKPTDVINASNMRDVISTIYYKIVNSNVSVKINDIDKLIIVKDNNCSLCKYFYDEMNISGCEILLGMVSEFINLISKEAKDMSSVSVEPYEIRESRTFGNNSCVQVYKYSIGKGA
ncbi:MAG: hypothetical protein ACTSRI_04560 [Promethearchaeota archaeon]